MSGLRFETDTQYVDGRLQEMLEALNNQDKTAVKSMFSQKALTEAVEFDEHLDYLFNFFQGKVLSWERKGGPSVFKNKEHGRITQEVSVWYKVDTDQESYLFIFIECIKDTANQNNVGLYTLRVIRTEDELTQFNSWNDVRIPGIYMP